jgi:hypothetical protein
MVRIYAGRVVALVANKHVRGYRADIQLIGDSMR